MPITRFRLNGVETEIDADPDSLLLDILRGRLGITGAHFGCGAGECGACRVIVGDHAVTACDAPLWSVANKDVTTVEGLGSVDRPRPLQRAFIGRTGVAMRLLRFRDPHQRGGAAAAEPKTFRGGRAHSPRPQSLPLRLA
jgi:aerobic-type carbon monoxide dehydrogenase small subunit (CoxS/CutS family)